MTPAIECVTVTAPDDHTPADPKAPRPNLLERRRLKIAAEI